MNQNIRELEEFLADYDLDVYEESELPDGKYKLQTVLIETNTNPFKVKLRVNRAINNANQILKDGVTFEVHDIKVKEKNEDEIDFDMVISVKEKSEEPTVKDSGDAYHGYDYMITQYWDHTDQLYQIAQAIQAAEDINNKEKKILLDKIQESFDSHIYDSVDVKDGVKLAHVEPHYEEVWGTRQQVEPGGYEVEEVWSDISNASLDWGNVYFDMTTNNMCSLKEAVEIFKERYNVRPVKDDEISEEFKETVYYEEGTPYFTDDLSIKTPAKLGGTYYPDYALSEPLDLDEIILQEGSTITKLDEEDFYEIGMEDRN